MKIINKKLIAKKTFIITVVSVAALTGVVFTLNHFGIISLFPKTNLPEISQEPSPEEKKSEEKINQEKKQEFAETTKNNQAQSVEVSKPAPVPSDNSTIDLSVSKNGDSATVIVKLKEQGYSQGKCTLTVSANGKKNSQEAIIIYQPEYSTCAGFSVPISSVGGGSWNISLSVTPLNGKTITKSITQEIR